MAVEYICNRCHAYVFNSTSATPPEHGRCFVCAFLEATIADPEERRAVRAHLDRDLADKDV